MFMGGKKQQKTQKKHANIPNFLCKVLFKGA